MKLVTYSNFFFFGGITNLIIKKSLDLNVQINSSCITYILKKFPFQHQFSHVSIFAHYMIILYSLFTYSHPILKFPIKFCSQRFCYVIMKKTSNIVLHILFSNAFSFLSV